MAKKTTAKKPNKPAGPPRKHILSAVEVKVVTQCRRHCCMCFGLQAVLKEVEGQIAHLDRNRSNADIDNLAFLCLDCHKKYDTKNNRVLSFTPAEIRYYRNELLKALNVEQIEWSITVTAGKYDSDTVRSIIQKAHAELLKHCPEAKYKEQPLE
jgi:hypothetical protein